MKIITNIEFQEFISQLDESTLNNEKNFYCENYIISSDHLLIKDIDFSQIEFIALLSSLFEKFKKNPERNYRITLNNVQPFSELTFIFSEVIRKSHNVTALDFSNNTFSNEDLQNLSEAILLNGCINSLVLDNINMNENIMKKIEHLMSSVNITSLSLGDNTFDYKSMLVLGNTLKNNENLTTLKLSNCGINESTFKYLANIIKNSRLQNLTEVDFSYNNIGDSIESETSIMYLLGVKSINSLNLCSTNIGVNVAYGIGFSIRTGSYFKLLNIENNKIGIYGIRNIVANIAASFSAINECTKIHGKFDYEFNQIFYNSRIYLNNIHIRPEHLSFFKDLLKTLKLYGIYVNSYCQAHVAEDIEPAEEVIDVEEFDLDEHLTRFVGQFDDLDELDGFGDFKVSVPMDFVEFAALEESLAPVEHSAPGHTEKPLIFSRTSNRIKQKKLQHQRPVDENLDEEDRMDIAPL